MENFDPDNTPISRPPPGKHTNLINPPSQAWQARVSIYTTLPLVLLFVLLRVYARLRLPHGIKADDCTPCNESFP